MDIRQLNGKAKGAWMVAALAVCVQSIPSGVATPASSSTQVQVAQGKAELAKGKFDKAIEILSKAAKTLGTAPGSCECHLCLGKALCAKAKSEKTAGNSASMTDYLAAKKELRTAIRVGKGNIISKQANEFLTANLPREILHPRSGDGTEMIAARLGLRGHDRGSGGVAKARIFEFYADWCEPCKKMKPAIAQMKQKYGDKFDVMSVNVDDANNAEIVDAYDVSPIPTMIFINQDGQVCGYSVGFAGEQNLEKELQKAMAETKS